MIDLLWTALRWWALLCWLIPPLLTLLWACRIATDRLTAWLTSWLRPRRTLRREKPHRRVGAPVTYAEIRRDIRRRCAQEDGLPIDTEHISN